MTGRDAPHWLAHRSPNSLSERRVRHRAARVMSARMKPRIWPRRERKDTAALYAREGRRWC